MKQQQQRLQPNQHPRLYLMLYVYYSKLSLLVGKSFGLWISWYIDFDFNQLFGQCGKNVVYIHNLNKDFTSESASGYQDQYTSDEDRRSQCPKRCFNNNICVENRTNITSVNSLDVLYIYWMFNLRKYLNDAFCYEKRIFQVIMIDYSNVENDCWVEMKLKMKHPQKRL